MSRIVFISLTVSFLCLVGCGKSKPMTASSAATAPKSTSAYDNAVPIIKPDPARPFEKAIDVCLIFSGEMRGYLQPCGCSRPQVGGLERRCELINRLKKHGYLISAADLGDLAPYDQSGDQARLKYETSVRSLQAMGYAAIGVGAVDAKISFEHSLSLAINYQPPHILAANLLDTELRFPEMFKAWTIQEPKGDKAIDNIPKVGYIGLIGPSVQEELKKHDKQLQFSNEDEALAKALKELNGQNPAVRVLLYQGTSEEMKKLLAKHKNVFDVVLTKNDAADGNAPSLPQKLDDKGIHIMVGHKGRSVGIVGWKKGAEPQYRLEDMVESLELPDSETNVCREIMRDYVRSVYSQDFLSKVQPILHPMQTSEGMAGATYVGSGRCAECHKEEFAVWEKSKHSKAFMSLKELGRPFVNIQVKDKPAFRIAREHDPDCVSCHVTGYGFKNGFVSPEKTAHILYQGCENCHGPGSLHVNQPNNPQYSKPMRLDLAVNQKVIENNCRKCHDLDNDPHFEFNMRWAEIKHGNKKPE